MNRALLVALTLVLSLAGCATQQRDSISARRKAYQRLLRNIEPEMTRRQLYALLLPARVPSALPLQPIGFINVTAYFPQEERHALDADFSLFVQYRLADRRAYSMKPLRQPSTAKDIDELLFGTSRAAVPRPSRENADDVLVARPVLLGLGVPRKKITINGSVLPEVSR